MNKRKVDWKGKIIPIKREKDQPMEWNGEFIGDILYGKEYIYGQMQKEDTGKIAPLITAFSYDPWKTLEIYGIKEIQNLKDLFKYECPWTKNTFYWFVPFGIIVYGSTDVYKNQKYNHDFCFDLKWHERMYKFEEPTNLEIAMLGHGYTFGTLPYDGSGSYNMVKIKLSNGDFIAGRVWIWYNK